MQAGWAEDVVARLRPDHGAAGWAHGVAGWLRAERAWDQTMSTTCRHFAPNAQQRMARKGCSAESGGIMTKTSSWFLKRVYIQPQPPKTYLVGVRVGVGMCAHPRCEWGGGGGRVSVSVRFGIRAEVGFMVEVRVGVRVEVRVAVEG